MPAPSPKKARRGLNIDFIGPWGRPENLMPPGSPWPDPQVTNSTGKGYGYGGGSSGGGLLNMLLGGGRATAAGGGPDVRDFLGNAGAMLMMLDPMSRAAGASMMGVAEDRRAQRASQGRANETAAWLVSQGVGPGEASFLASNPNALNSWYTAWKTGEKPDWQFHDIVNEDGSTQTFLIDMDHPERRQAVGGVKRAAPMSVAPGNVVIDPSTGKPIFTAPQEPKAPDIQTIFDPATGQEVKVQWNPQTNQWDRVGGLKAAEPKAPQIETFYDPQTGQEQKVQWNPQTSRWEKVGGLKAPSGFSIKTNPDGTVELSQGPQKMTEGQSRMTLFQTMQNQTQPALLDLEKQWNPANIPDVAARSAPIGGNFLLSQQGQIYKSLASAWAEAALRISTGQAGPSSEIDRIVNTYFAQVGDTPDTIAFKAQMREMYSRAINASLGQNISGSLPTPSEFLKQQQQQKPGGGGGGSGDKTYNYDANGNLVQQP